MNLKKKVIFGVVAGFFAVATIFNMGLLNDNGTGDLSLDAIAIMAQAQSEGPDYSVGYINNPEECTITETVECTIGGIIYTQWGPIDCTIGFSYPITHDGTQNYCTYTGGPGGCSFHTCQKNN
ncbi:hypothetical protein [Marinilabilia rubra]|uniref:Uncharacterized protein n=1 Tax=Marinilabilia rubra TaxID=2162893 RepID=A0A2U2B7J2_9BACT|nr:hypothetical protein [Marinilabilia rubra]PWD99013.1 hypothetical protein DDZ16_12165 [Marinilabilia rubra]